MSPGGRERLDQRCAGRRGHVRWLFVEFTTMNPTSLAVSAMSVRGTIATGRAEQAARVRHGAATLCRLHNESPGFGGSCALCTGHLSSGERRPVPEEEDTS